jgi:hypothetical protein
MPRQPSSTTPSQLSSVPLHVSVAGTHGGTHASAAAISAVWRDTRE